MKIDIKRIKTTKGTIEQRTYSDIDTDTVMCALTEVFVASALAGRAPKLRPLPRRIRKRLAQGGLV